MSFFQTSLLFIPLFHTPLEQEEPEAVYYIEKNESQADLNSNLGPIT